MTGCSPATGHGMPRVSFGSLVKRMSIVGSGVGDLRRRTDVRQARRGMRDLAFILACALALMVGSLGIRPPPLIRLRGASARRLQAVAAAPVGERDREVRLGFFLQISDSTMGHLPRLLRKIWEPCNLYAIHVDAKVHSTEGKNTLHMLQQRLQAENGQYASNVHFMEPELITYRGVSMLLNTINGMQLLLEKGNFDFFINLSGSDYPLVTPSRQRAFLATASRQHNYIAFAPREKWALNNMYRYSHFWVDEALAFPKAHSDVQGGSTAVRTRVVEVARENPVAHSHISEFTYANAEAWMITSRQFCEYVTKSAAARKLLATFAFSVESSEHYFSTLAYNSRFNGTLVHSSLRHIVWEHNGRSAGQHPYFVDDDLPGLQEKVLRSPKFYTRKFKHPDSPLMDLIDRRAEDPSHLEQVDEHFKWLITTARQRAAEQQETKFPFD